MGDFSRELLDAARSEQVRDREESDMLVVGAKILGLLEESEHFHGIKEEVPWRRGGAESFICSGVIQVSSGASRVFRERQILVKAYAGFGLGVSPEERVAQWRTKASILEKAGIGVSRIYGTFRGAMFVDFLPLNLADAIRHWPEAVPGLLARSRKLAWILDQLRAEPTCLLRDLRSDGREVSMIDFGEDLGPIPGESRTPDACRQLLEREVDALLRDLPGKGVD